MTGKHRQQDLAHFLEQGDISFFGYLGKPLHAVSGRKGRVRFFLKQGKEGGLPALSYGSLSDAGSQSADVYFFDHEALKIFVAGFPGGCRYALARLAPRGAWLLALPGLARRLLNGQLALEGVATFSASGSPTRWLVLRNRWAQEKTARLHLSAEIGIQGLLDYLRRERVNYVILKFYEHLPALHREGGDLDMLVADEDEERVRAFIKASGGGAGAIDVDLYALSGPDYNDIPYVLPPLARQALRNAIDGPGGSRIPSPKDAFLLLAYNVVYQKGTSAGVPSRTKGISVNPHPENDYTGELRSRAAQAGVSVPITLEDLDEYLAAEGWRPKSDTLRKMTLWNEWVWRRFFSGEEREEVGLGALIIKEKAFSLGVAEDILATVRAHEGFKILRTRRFAAEEKERVAGHLRGGVWTTRAESGREFLPAMAVVVLDTHLARQAKAGAWGRNPGHGIRRLKEDLRRKFDAGKGMSLVHSTDTTPEAWEYIGVSFPGEMEDIRKEIERVREGITLSYSEVFLLRVRAAPAAFLHRARVHVRTLRGNLINLLMR